MTESQSVVQRHDDGSFAEVGTWTHNGVPFSAGGAYRSPDGAIVSVRRGRRQSLPRVKRAA
jgi:hypothetical protein